MKQAKDQYGRELCMTGTLTIRMRVQVIGKDKLITVARVEEVTENEAACISVDFKKDNKDIEDRCFAYWQEYRRYLG